MSSKSYKREMKLKVAKEAIRPENTHMEHIIAEKYGIMPWTVTRWKKEYLEAGEEAFKRSVREIQQEKERAELKQEVEILKKAAAFLANVKHE